MSIATTIFDACILQVLVPLACGAGALLIPPGQQANAAVVADLLQREQPTVILVVVPVLLREYLMELQSRGAPSVSAVPSLREISCGGERVPPELAALARQVRVWRQHGGAVWVAAALRELSAPVLSCRRRLPAPPAPHPTQVVPSLQRFIDAYGPTEVTVVVRWQGAAGPVKATAGSGACMQQQGPTSALWPSPPQSTHSVVPPGAKRLFIGPPDENMHAYVVDRSMRMLPLGALGELVLSGPRVTAGECRIDALP